MKNQVQNFSMTEQEGELTIKGELTFSTVIAVYDKAQQFFSAREKLIVNLQSVTKSDSASLALIARWMRLAKKNHLQLFFSNIPQNMLDVARVSGMDEILPIAR